MKCLIVDDEPIAREILGGYIARLPGVELLGSCKNATEAYEALIMHRPDLIFLDIRMPVISGIEFLRSLNNPPLVIFSTAYPDYAAEGFELYATDYLLKPVTFERFCIAIDRAKARLRAGQSAEAVKNITPPDFLFIRQQKRLIKLMHDDIIVIKAERDYCYIHKTNERLLVSLHMKKLEEQLPSQTFLRIHRSFIVNLHKVQALSQSLVELPGQQVPIGENYRKQLYAALHLNAGE